MAGFLGSQIYFMHFLWIWKLFEIIFYVFILGVSVGSKVLKIHEEKMKKSSLTNLTEFSHGHK